MSLHTKVQGMDDYSKIFMKHATKTASRMAIVSGEEINIGNVCYDHEIRGIYTTRRCSKSAERESKRHLAPKPGPNISKKGRKEVYIMPK